MPCAPRRLKRASKKSNRVGSALQKRSKRIFTESRENRQTNPRPRPAGSEEGRGSFGGGDTDQGGTDHRGALTRAGGTGQGGTDGAAVASSIGEILRVLTHCLHLEPGGGCGVVAKAGDVLWFTETQGLSIPTPRPALLHLFQTLPGCALGRTPCFMSSSRPGGAPCPPGKDSGSLCQVVVMKYPGGRSQGENSQGSSQAADVRGTPGSRRIWGYQVTPRDVPDCPQAHGRSRSTSEGQGQGQPQTEGPRAPLPLPAMAQPPWGPHVGQRWQHSWSSLHRRPPARPPVSPPLHSDLLQGQDASGPFLGCSPPAAEESGPVVLKFSFQTAGLSAVFTWSLRPRRSCRQSPLGTGAELLPRSPPVSPVEAPPQKALMQGPRAGLGSSPGQAPTSQAAAAPSSGQSSVPHCAAGSGGGPAQSHQRAPVQAAARPVPHARCPYPCDGLAPPLTAGALPFPS